MFSGTGNRISITGCLQFRLTLIAAMPDRADCMDQMAYAEVKAPSQASLAHRAECQRFVGACQFWSCRSMNGTTEPVTGKRASLVALTMASTSSVEMSALIIVIGLGDAEYV